MEVRRPLVLREFAKHIAIRIHIGPVELDQKSEAKLSALQQHPHQRHHVQCVLEARQNEEPVHSMLGRVSIELEFV